MWFQVERMKKQTMERHTRNHLDYMCGKIKQSKTKALDPFFESNDRLDILEIQSCRKVSSSRFKRCNFNRIQHLCKTMIFKQFNKIQHHQNWSFQSTKSMWVLTTNCLQEREHKSNSEILIHQPMRVILLKDRTWAQVVLNQQVLLNYDSLSLRILQSNKLDFDDM